MYRLVIKKCHCSYHFVYNHITNLSVYMQIIVTKNIGENIHENARQLLFTRSILEIIYC